MSCVQKCAPGCFFLFQLPKGNEKAHTSPPCFGLLKSKISSMFIGIMAGGQLSKFGFLNSASWSPNRSCSLVCILCAAGSWSTRRPCRVTNLLMSHEMHVPGPCIWNAARPVDLDFSVNVSMLISREEIGGSPPTLCAERWGVQMRDLCSHTALPLHTICFPLSLPLSEYTHHSHVSLTKIWFQAFFLGKPWPNDFLAHSEWLNLTTLLLGDNLCFLVPTGCPFFRAPYRNNFSLAWEQILWPGINF